MWRPGSNAGPYPVERAREAVWIETLGLSPSASFHCRLPRVTAVALRLQVVPIEGGATLPDRSNVVDDVRGDHESCSRARCTQRIGGEVRLPQSAPTQTVVKAVVSCRVCSALTVVFPIPFTTMLEAEAIMFASSRAAKK